MKLFATALLLLGISGELHAAIDAVYAGTTGVRNNVFTVCLQCHSSTLSGSARHNAPTFVDFDTYADASASGDLAVTRAVTQKTMPPTGYPLLNQEQGNALLAWQAAGFPETSSTPADTQAPTVPGGLTATAASGSQVNLTWTAATDNVGVTAYKIYRGGILRTTLGNVTSYSDTGLSASTTYSYSVAACDAAGNCSAQSAAVSVTTPSNAFIYNIPSSTNVDQPFLRIYNTSSSSGQVRGTLYDQSGSILGNSNSVLLSSLAANSVAVLTAADVASAIGAATWAGRAWLKVEADFTGVKAMNLIRSSLLLSMSCLETDKAYYIPAPSVTGEQAFIRLYNPSDSAGSISGTLYDENGNVLGTANAVLVSSLAAHAVTVLDAATLASLIGATTWTGRAWLSLTSGIAGLRVMNTLRDLVTNTLANASCSVESTGTIADVLNIPSPASATTATIRIYNTSSTAMSVTGTAYDESGATVGTSAANLGSIPARGVLVLSNSALASLIGASSWSGRAWLRVVSNVAGLKVLAMTRQQSLMEMSCAESTYAFNIPDAGNGQDHPFIRLYNTGTSAGSVSGTLYDQGGAVLGSANSILVSNMAAHSVTEFSASALASAVGVSSWTARAWLKLSTSLTGIKILDILEDQAGGNRANMSCATN